MMQMNFMKPVTSRSYGDKEIIWLAFATNGDESYHFNKYYAAAIGTLTPDVQRLTKDGKPKRGRWHFGMVQFWVSYVWTITQGQL